MKRHNSITGLFTKSGGDLEMRVFRIILFAMLPMVIMVGCGQHVEHKPDDILLANFCKHRKEFEELHRMAATDTNLFRVDASRTDPPDATSAGVSPRRVAAYRKLLYNVGCPGGLMAFPARPGIRFISSSRGLLNRGSSKGFCYLEPPPVETVTNTATDKSLKPGPYVVYRHIDGAWYLFFERGN